jgi:hypothetical protein
VSAEFTESDLDRLADFVAGVLDEPDTSVVAGLIRRVPSWSTAYSALLTANETVSARLRVESCDDEPMPDDVAAAVAASLRHARQPAHRHRAPAPRSQAHPGAGSPAQSSTRPSVPQSATRSRPANSPGPARRRRLMTGVAAAAVAVVAVVAGVTVSSGMLGTSSLSTRNGAADSANGAPEVGAVPQPAIGSEPAVPARYLATGRDYRRDTLGQLARVTSSNLTEPSMKTASGAGAAPSDVVGGVAPQLLRLTDLSALGSCLGAIAGAHPGVPGVIDFARFDGTPALVVLVNAPTSQTVVVVGPDCGIAGADERVAVQP